MSYAPNPMQALAQRARYLCTKHGVGVNNNSWNPCWRVWVELVQKLHLVWPAERVELALALGKEERPSIGPATIVQGTVQVYYCDSEGKDTGSDTFYFEWYCPLVLKFSDEDHDEHWELPLGSSSVQHDAWLRRLLGESTLRRLALQPPKWKRCLGHIDEEDATDANAAEVNG